MNLFQSIRNSLPSAKEQILNSIDRGVGAIGISLSSTNEGNLKDLTDLTLVNKTIANARRAFEIDPTVRSSILSTVIIATGDWEIEGDKNASDNAINHIRRKAKEWDLNQLLNGQAMKETIDGKCFIRKKGFNNDITNVDFLAFDESTYNFIELKNQNTGQVMGYKQKAMVYNIPKDWKNTNFDSLVQLKGEEKESNFEPNEVIYPKLFNDGASLVYGSLDDVYNLKKIKNAGPTIVKRALMTLGVEVGAKDAPLKPWDENDILTYQQKKDLINAELKKFGEDFSKKETKDTITHSFGVRPYMIGDGKLVDITPFVNLYKQEIREVILTPDSRFNSATTNKATTESQLGNKGQMTVITYIQDNLNYYNSQYLFDDQLSRAAYKDDVGLINIKFTPLELENNLKLSQIGQSLEQTYPSQDDIDKDIRLQTYYPDYYQAKQKHEADMNNTDENGQVLNTIKETPKGFIEEQKGTMRLIESWKKFMIEEELVKPPMGKGESA